MDNKNKLIYPELSYKIVGIIYSAYNNLGYGYQEKYYQKAIALDLYKINIVFEREKIVPIAYRNKMIGNYRVDFLIENCIILETKVGNDLHPNYTKQVLGYLRHLKIKLAIIALITPDKVILKRIVL